MRADGDPAGGYEHVCPEPTLDRGAMGCLVVRDRSETLDQGSGRPERGGEHDTVRLVDLAGTQLLTRRAELRPRRHDRYTGTGAAAHLPDAAGGKSGYASGGEHEPGREHRITRSYVAALWPDVVAGSGVRRYHYAVAMVDNILEGHHRVCAFGHDAARCDAHCLTGCESDGCGATRSDTSDNRERPRCVRSTQGKAVHGRAGKWRQVDTRPRGLGEDAAVRVRKRGRRRRQRLYAGQHAGERLVDGEQVGHALNVDDRPPIRGSPGRALALRRSSARPGRWPHRAPTGYPRGVISVVIPVYDEEQSVELLYSELVAALDPLERAWEAVFVDDGSTDGTFGALTRLNGAYENVRVVRLRRNFGKAAALDAGFTEASGELIVTIDGDLQDDPAEIPRLLDTLDEGYDLVSGWKTQRRDPLTRRVPSRIFNGVAGRVSGLRLHDMNCGLKAYRAEVVHGMPLYGELHRYIPVLAHYRGYRVTELPVNHRAREHGRSRYGAERYVRGFLDLLTVTFMGRYRHRPLHLFGSLGLITVLIGLVILVYLTALKVAGQAIGHRPLLTLGVLLVVVGIQFLSLGLLSELITSQHEERVSGLDRTSRFVDEVLR